MSRVLLSLFIGSFLLSAGCQPHRGYSDSFRESPSLASQVNLAQLVQEALIRHDELAATSIQVETRQNTVILSGYVKKIRQSDSAEQIARQIPGVQSVENRIIVRP